MKYQQLKILFTTPRAKIKPFSWAIKSVQGWSDASHAAVLFPEDINGHQLVYHADGWMTQYLPLEQFEEGNSIVHEFSFTVPKSTMLRVKYLCDTTAGTPYGFLQLLGILLHTNAFSDRGKSYICTEVVALVLGELGHVITRPERLTPYQLFRWCRELVDTQKEHP